MKTSDKPHPHPPTSDIKGGVFKRASGQRVYVDTDRLRDVASGTEVRIPDGFLSISDGCYRRGGAR